MRIFETSTSWGILATQKGCLTTTKHFSTHFAYHNRFTAVKEGINNHGSFWFLVDNTRVAYVDEPNPDDYHPQGGETITLELTAGQSVRIENQDWTTIYGTDSSGVLRSWFTGFLLYELA